MTYQLSRKESVLDEIAFVRLVEVMGGDSSIVQAARVSYGLGIKDHETDKKLIKYLLEHDHGTPFEMVQFKFHAKCPIFVMRQWVRHRIGSFNEISGRYSEIKDEHYSPKEWRGPDNKNKQGSIPINASEINVTAYSAVVGRQLDYAYEELIDIVFRFYKELLEKG